MATTTTGGAADLTTPDKSTMMPLDRDKHGKSPPSAMTAPLSPPSSMEAAEAVAAAVAAEAAAEAEALAFLNADDGQEEDGAGGSGDADQVGADDWGDAMEAFGFADGDDDGDDDGDGDAPSVGGNDTGGGDFDAMNPSMIALTVAQLGGSGVDGGIGGAVACPGTAAKTPTAAPAPATAAAAPISAPSGKGPIAPPPKRRPSLRASASPVFDPVVNLGPHFTLPVPMSATSASTPFVTAPVPVTAVTPGAAAVSTPPAAPTASPKNTGQMAPPPPRPPRQSSTIISASSTSEASHTMVGAAAKKRSSGASGATSGARIVAAGSNVSAAVAAAAAAVGAPIPAAAAATAAPTATPTSKGPLGPPPCRRPSLGKASSSVSNPILNFGPSCTLPVPASAAAVPTPFAMAPAVAPAAAPSITMPTAPTASPTSTGQMAPPPPRPQRQSSTIISASSTTEASHTMVGAAAKKRSSGASAATSGARIVAAGSNVSAAAAAAAAVGAPVPAAAAATVAPTAAPSSKGPLGKASSSVSNPILNFGPSCTLPVPAPAAAVPTPFAMAPAVAPAAAPSIAMPTAPLASLTSTGQMAPAGPAGGVGYPWNAGAQPLAAGPTSSSTGWTLPQFGQQQNAAVLAGSGAGGDGTSDVVMMDVEGATVAPAAAAATAPAPGSTGGWVMGLTVSSRSRATSRKANFASAIRARPKVPGLTTWKAALASAAKDAAVRSRLFTSWATVPAARQAGVRPDNNNNNVVDEALATAMAAVDVSDTQSLSPAAAKDIRAQLDSAVALVAAEELSEKEDSRTTTEMLDSALSECAEKFFRVGDRPADEEEASFREDVVSRADLGRAMVALRPEGSKRKAEKEAEVRAILGDARRRRSRRIRSSALAKIKGGQSSTPSWDYLSLRKRWRKGELLVL